MRSRSRSKWGTAIWLDNGEDSRTSYGTGLGSNGTYLNAVMDTTLATLASPGGAAIRVAPNQQIDFSGKATAASQNQHTVQYSTYNNQNAFIYNINQNTAFKIADVGGWLTNYGPASLGLNNCASMTTGFPPSGTTMCWNESNGVQESDMIVGQGGLDVFPVSSSGTISSTPVFYVNSMGNGGLTGSLSIGNNLNLANGKSVVFTDSTTNKSSYLYQDTDGYVKIATAGGDSTSDIQAGNLRVTNNLTLATTTVANLPTCSSSTTDVFRAVSDAKSPTYNGALTGGGSTTIPVFCNGSAWTAH